MELRNKNRDPKKSMAARRHRQMAWFLYFTKGAKVNFDHALKTNSFCMSAHDVAQIEKLRRQQEQIVSKLEALVSNV